MISFGKSGYSGGFLIREQEWGFMVTQVAIWKVIIRGFGTKFYGHSGSHKHTLLEPILHTTSVATQVSTSMDTQVATSLGTINTIGNNSSDSSSQSWKCHMVW
jgi:hypothetical protein